MKGAEPQSWLGLGVKEQDLPLQYQVWSVQDGSAVNMILMKSSQFSFGSFFTLRSAPRDEQPDISV